MANGGRVSSTAAPAHTASLGSCCRQWSCLWRTFTMTSSPSPFSSATTLRVRGCSQPAQHLHTLVHVLHVLRRT